MEKYVLRKEGFGIETILIDGYSEFRKLPEKHFIAEGYTIIKPEEFDQYYESYINQLCYNWSEIDEGQYYEALEVLPPVKWFDGGFFISEPTMGDIHAFYQKLDNKYYTSNVRVSSSREDIIYNLKEWIKEN